jgi:hypothetical protein
VYVADDPYQDDHEEMDILVLENGSNGLILTSRGAKLKKTFLGPEEEVIFRIE